MTESASEARKPERLRCHRKDEEFLYLAKARSSSARLIWIRRPKIEAGLEAGEQIIELRLNDEKQGDTALVELSALSPRQLIDGRYDKFRRMGAFFAEAS